MVLFAAIPGRDFNFTAGSKLHFTDVYSLKSPSFDTVMILIINDDIAEPCESFICTLQGGALDAVHGSEPNQVTIEICDDDREYMHVLEFIQSNLMQITGTYVYLFLLFPFKH